MKSSKLFPNAKVLTVKELRKLEIPDFQRWVVPSNIRELESSIDSVGMLRCPVVAYVEETDKTYIIDGNHMRNVILNSGDYEETDKILCIYNELKNYCDAAEQFRQLNTKGAKLDWVDITNLYRHIHGVNSVYHHIWSLFLGAPANPDEVPKYKGYTLPTIIEFLVRDKAKYREGGYETNLPEKYIDRKNLLTYLIHNSQSSWDKEFSPSEYRPNGGAMIGFANLWFNNNLHKKFTEQTFLIHANRIFKNNQSLLKSGKLVINRDTAGAIMKEHLMNFYKDLKLK